MVRRRCAQAGILTKAGNHTFRATGLTTFLANQGEPASHASIETTQLYDRRRLDLTLDEVERIVLMRGN
jgi:integrase